MKLQVKTLWKIPVYCVVASWISFYITVYLGQLFFVVKEIKNVTGYIRGGCTPIGMKKQFPTFIQKSASEYEKIYVSGGRLGATLKLNPHDLAKVTRAEFADFIVDK